MTPNSHPTVCSAGYIGNSEACPERRKLFLPQDLSAKRLCPLRGTLTLPSLGETEVAEVWQQGSMGLLVVWDTRILGFVPFCIGGLPKVREALFGVRE